ncbi:DNA gyrase inhibitor [Pseudomonas phage vB_PaeP_PaCe]|uniref:Uncharacterized protein n=3 Tax=Viruses TaxID=10239 RepID=W0XAD2_9CAUD|nr:hypothetical protein CF76_gp06 [Pseudomonas phage TL]YP_009125577.1 hypothetical protein VC51_gp09 [Pseudomonas phage vB_PaeP_C2-10_Ab22]QHB49012.1 hypothetical protein U47_08 [Pseudomonas phage U47]QIQ67250.1 hypothetical protein oldone_8 [Pseudomonas phage oldone]URG14331.1 DNA gyrase inhibitor [Pseudomonas phage vB_PaeP_PaCe]UVN13798.1 hypothetical protein FBPa29_0046 [Pseudomonas phage vB_PaeP_FBPa29]UYE90137.1 hypothetical protein [Pseudomonas phage PaeP_Ls]WNV48524.1 hypothetical pr
MNSTKPQVFWLVSKDGERHVKVINFGQFITETFFELGIPVDHIVHRVQ